LSQQAFKSIVECALRKNPKNLFTCMVASRWSGAFIRSIGRRVWVYRWEINNDKYITSLADDTRSITTAPALFPNTRTDTTIKTRFTVGTWDRTECTGEAPVAPTIVLHHNPSADVYIHIGYMAAAAAKRKEIDTALYTRAYTDSSIYRPLLWRVYRGSTTSICGFVGYLFLLFGID